MMLNHLLKKAYLMNGDSPLPCCLSTLDWILSLIKANQKLSALSGISKLIVLDQ